MYTKFLNAYFQFLKIVNLVPITEVLVLTPVPRPHLSSNDL